MNLQSNFFAILEKWEVGTGGAECLRMLLTLLEWTVDPLSYRERVCLLCSITARLEFSKEIFDPNLSYQNELMVAIGNACYLHKSYSGLTIFHASPVFQWFN